MMIAESAELHQMQRAFRSVLDAFAQPGTLHLIEPTEDKAARPVALDGALETLVKLFVDQAVTFCVADAETDAASAYVTSETHALRVAVSEADFVIVPRRADEQVVAECIVEACRGTLVAPEKGATVLLGCAHVAAAEEGAADAGPALQVVEVHGPGVKDVNRFAVDRLGWLSARAARGDEFPCGIEIVLVDAQGHLVALPRSSRVAPTLGAAAFVAAGEVR
ncbi:MAG: phosphonate C-P lyase system protein PhnH [Gordonibacter sp.]|uniref:phosphonate C-P lyase system protein PhnH n=1 Tax=Gordonibacter sp. TaxID=1968902 RepID=UPI002FC7B35C